MCRGGESALYLNIIMIIVLINVMIIKVMIINVKKVTPLWFGALSPFRLLQPVPLLLPFLLVVRVQVLHHRRQSHLMVINHRHDDDYNDYDDDDSQHCLWHTWFAIRTFSDSSILQLNFCRHQHYHHLIIIV